MIGALIAKRMARELFALVNRRDVQGFMSAWTDDAVMLYPGDVPGVSGPHAGKGEIEAWLRNLLDTFPACRFTVRHVAIDNILAVTLNNTIATHFDVETLNRKGVQTQTSGVAVTTLGGGKIVRDQISMRDTGDAFRTMWCAPREPASAREPAAVS